MTKQYKTEAIKMIFEKVKNIIVDQLDVDEEKVTMNANIQDDLGADSLDIVDLVMSFEDEFDLEIPDDQVENIKTVGDVTLPGYRLLPSYRIRTYRQAYRRKEARNILHPGMLPG